MPVDIIAKELDVEVGTVRRHRDTPEIKQRVADLRREMVGEAIGFLSRVGRDAAEVLHRLAMDDGTPAHVRMSSAKSILELGLKLREHDDHEERIRKLESQLAGEQQSPPPQQEPPPLPATPDA